MAENKTLEYNPNKTYFFGDIIKWEGEKRLLVTGSSIGVAPSAMYLIWKKYGE